MTLSYLMFAIAVTLVAAIPYKAFSNWKKSKTNKNLIEIANKYKFSIINSDPPLEYPSLSGIVDEVFVAIETTWTKDGGKFPVTHIEATINPVRDEEKTTNEEKATDKDGKASEKQKSGEDSVNKPYDGKQYEVKILPNKTFMTTPEERYIKTDKKTIDALYLIGIKRARLADEIESLKDKAAVSKAKNVSAENNEPENTEEQKPSTEGTADINHLAPVLIKFLEEGVQKNIHQGQLIIKRNFLKYSAPEHPFSDESLKRMEFLLNKLPELAKLSAKDLLFEK